MSTWKPSFEFRELVTTAKQASILWFLGFREACCLHRVMILCLRSRKLSIRTGQCFLLNGFIFLGSIFVLKSMIIPTLLWIIPENCTSQESCSFIGLFKLYSLLRGGLLQLFYVLWFYPLYILSFILSALWYNDIAKYGFSALEGDGPFKKSLSQNEDTPLQNIVQTQKAAGLGGVMIGIGEQVYSILLLSFFFLEVSAIGCIPYIGKAFNFVLLSWMYAYYCFEYKWKFSEVSLDKRLDLFETNWVFFAGFGNPCVLAIFYFSPLVSYGVMAMLFPLMWWNGFEGTYPLLSINYILGWVASHAVGLMRYFMGSKFVLTATGSRAEELIEKSRSPLLGRRLPIFYGANVLSMWVLSLFSLEESKRE